MIWKHLSIEKKLFVAIVATTGLIVLVMTVLLMLTMRAGFSRYLLNAEMNRFDDMVASLAQSYDPGAQGWPEYSVGEDGQDRAWRTFTRQQLNPQGEFAAGRPPPGRELPGLGPDRVDNRRGGRRAPGPTDPLQIGTRLALQNPSGQTIAGPDFLPSPTVRRAIVAEGNADDGAVLGYLVLAAPPGGRASGDAVFLNDQLRMLAIVALCAIVLSGLAAFLLARQFTAPVNDLIKGTERLTRGEYAERMMTERRDEFGRLIESFNRLAAHLEASDRSERQWMSDTSHELKTPLAILRAEIEAIQDGVREPDEKNMANLHQAVLRLQDLVQDISALAQAREGQLLMAAHLEDFSALVRAVAETNRALIGGSGLTFDIRIEPDIKLFCDPRRMEQLMQNLLVNSSRYTLAPGVVRIALYNQDGEITLVVEDSAPCPAETSVERLFDRFFRDEASRSRHLGGSGLGLAICREIVIAHGGTIEASQSELGGLRVIARFTEIKGDKTHA